MRWAFEIEGDGRADEIFQGGFIQVFVFVDVDGAPEISFEAGIKKT